MSDSPWAPRDPSRDNGQSWNPSGSTPQGQQPTPEQVWGQQASTPQAPQQQNPYQQNPQRPYRAGNPTGQPGQQGADQPAWGAQGSTWQNQASAWQPQQTHPGNRKKQPALPFIIGGGALVLIIAIVAAAIALKPDKAERADATTGQGTSQGTGQAAGTSTDPVATVTSYFQAVISGDADKALSFGAAEPPSRTLLTSEVLKAAQKENPITDLKVTPGSQSDYRATANVSYRVAGQSVSDSVRLRRADTSEPWHLDKAAADVYVSSMASGAKVGGVEVTDTRITLFPGVYTLSSGNDYVTYGDGKNQITVKSPTSYSSGYSALSAKLTTKGTQAWRDAVRSAMKTCLASTKVSPPNCPWSLTGTSRDGYTVTDGTIHYSSGLTSIDTATPRLSSGSSIVKGSISEKITIVAMGTKGSSGQSKLTGYKYVSAEASVDLSKDKPTVTWN